MHPREYLRTDLREAIADARGEDAADTLTDIALERDSKADYLLGLEHNCVCVLYWTRATETITDEPLTTGRTDRTKWRPVCRTRTYGGLPERPAIGRGITHVSWSQHLVLDDSYIQPI